MEVSYTTTVKDYVAFSFHMWRKSRVGRGSYLFAWFWLPVLGLLGAAVSALYGLFLVTAVCLVVAVVYAATYPGSYHRRLRNYIRDYAKRLGTQGIIGPIRLILSNESLVEITETTRSEIRWRDMKGIEEADGYTFILVTGMSAAIVPRHAFTQEDEYYAVRDFARARIKDAAEPFVAAVRPRD